MKTGRSESEKGNAQFRRSLYVCKPIKKGEPITRDNVRSVRPGFGLAPRYLEQIVGKTIADDVEVGTPLSWALLKLPTTNQ